MYNKRLILSDLLGPAEYPQHFRAGDVDIHKSQAGNSPTEIGLVPDVFEGREPSGEVIQAPDIDPGEHCQEEANLEGKNGKHQAE
jgi:hypothetical protein